MTDLLTAGAAQIEPFPIGNYRVTVTFTLPKEPTMSVAVVRYKTKPERAEENAAFIEKVFAELNASHCRPALGRRWKL